MPPKKPSRGPRRASSTPRRGSAPAKTHGEGSAHTSHRPSLTEVCSRPREGSNADAGCTGLAQRAKRHAAPCSHSANCSNAKTKHSRLASPQAPTMRTGADELRSQLIQASSPTTSSTPPPHTQPPSSSGKAEPFESLRPGLMKPRLGLHSQRSASAAPDAKNYKKQRP